MNESRLPCGPAADGGGGQMGLQYLCTESRGALTRIIFYSFGGKKSLYLINLGQLNVYLFLFVGLKTVLFLMILAEHGSELFYINQSKSIKLHLLPTL